MSDETVRPALTPEEWANALRFAGSLSPRGSVLDYDSSTEDATPEAAHYLAALCLHGQSFGFTRDDVMDLVTAANDARQLAITAPQLRVQATGLADRLENLSVRIAALLAPKEPGGP